MGRLHGGPGPRPHGPRPLVSIEHSLPLPLLLTVPVSTPTAQQQPASQLPTLLLATHFPQATCSSVTCDLQLWSLIVILIVLDIFGLCRCNEEPVEEDVKKRSQTEEAMGAKSLCHPFAKV